MRPILAVILGAIVAALLAWVACLLVDEFAIPHVFCILAIVLAIIMWIVWSFPSYFGGRFA